jgi:hypothetical protein
MAVTQKQVCQTAQQNEERHQANLQQLRHKLLEAQAQQQATQATDLQRILKACDQEPRAQRKQADLRWQRELAHQQQEAAATTQDLT